MTNKKDDGTLALTFTIERLPKMGSKPGAANGGVASGELELLFLVHKVESEYRVRIQRGRTGYGMDTRPTLRIRGERKQVLKARVALQKLVEEQGGLLKLK